MKKWGDWTYYRTINVGGIEIHPDMHKKGILHLMDFNPYHYVQNKSMVLLSVLQNRRGFIPISPTSDIYKAMENGYFSEKLENAKKKYNRNGICYLALQDHGGSIIGYGCNIVGFEFNRFEHWLPKNWRKSGLKRKKSAIFLKS